VFKKVSFLAFRSVAEVLAERKCGRHSREFFGVRGGLKELRTTINFFVG